MNVGFSESLNARVSAKMADNGYILKPMGTDKNGNLVWPRFLPRPQSHMLMVAPPSRSRCLDSAVKSAIDDANAPIVEISGDQHPTPLLARAKLATVADAMDGPALIVIDGLESLLGGVRRESTMNAVMDTVISLLDNGPENGVHVLLAQKMTEDGCKMLARLNVDWDWLAVVGRLSPVCSEIALGNGWASSIPLKSKTMYLRERTGGNGSMSYLAVRDASK